MSNHSKEMIDVTAGNGLSKTARYDDLFDRLIETTWDSLKNMIQYSIEFGDPEKADKIFQLVKKIPFQIYDVAEYKTNPYVRATKYIILDEIDEIESLINNAFSSDLNNAAIMKEDFEKWNSIFLQEKHIIEDINGKNTIDRINELMNS